MNEDRSGIDKLRAAIEDVAKDIESRETASIRTRHLWALGGAMAAAVVLIALLLGTWALRPSPEVESSEVKVLVLKINGRDVRPRIVDDTAPATIIVMPQPNGGAPSAAASALLGGVR